MQPPDTITIGGLVFRIVRREMENTYGAMHFDKREIAIAPGLSDADFSDTLRHEMIHATLAIAGHSHAEKYDEEPIVRAMENIFFPAWEKLNTDNQ
jgi:hypothetical protein